MHYRGAITGLIIFVIMLATVGAAWWLITHPPKAAEKPASKPPFTVTLNESQLTVITLTPDALARLAIETGQIEHKPMAPTRLLGGEVIVPPGQSIIVSAPVNGVLKARTGISPSAGHQVQKNAPVFQLVPLLTPEGRASLATALVDAIGQVKAAEAQQKAAKIAHDRAKLVFEKEAGSRRAVDEAQAQLQIAEALQTAAVDRQVVLEKLLGQSSSGTAAPLTIESPRDGMIRTLSALPEQQVPAGAPLFEVVDVSQLWVRVPVFVGDSDQVDETAQVSVTRLTARPGAQAVKAQPIQAPPTADASAATLDLYYALTNEGQKFRPGERIAAHVKLKGETDSLTVPWSAVFYDVYGGTWVYERTADSTFIRRRVVVRSVQDGIAVLDSGPPPGTKVVTAGAAELFGTETGFTK